MVGGGKGEEFLLRKTDKNFCCDKNYSCARFMEMYMVVYSLCTFGDASMPIRTIL